MDLPELEKRSPTAGATAEVSGPAQPSSPCVHVEDCRLKLELVHVLVIVVEDERGGLARAKV